MNQRISSVTGYNAFTMMFCRNALPFKDYSNVKVEEYTAQDEERWRKLADKMVTLIFPVTYKRIEKHQAKVRAELDAKRKLIKEGYYPIGAVVNILDPVRLSKSEAVYIGPYTIVSKRGGAYRVKDSMGVELSRGVPPDQIKLISKPKRGEVDQVYEVERIIGHKGKFPNIKYLVKWLNYPDDEATYEPIENFEDTKCIQEYWSALKLKNIDLLIEDYMFGK